jgi:transcriptional regulator with XRE-family HTH domain
VKKTLRGDRIIGQKIKFERRRMGLSQMKLGEMVGVTYQQIQKYESGEDRITVDRLRQVAQALRLSLLHLLTETSSAVQEIPPDYQKLGHLTHEETALVEAFRGIKDRSYRKQILSLSVLGKRIKLKKG